MCDELQKIPDLWDYIRLDNDLCRGAYLLTGSVTPKEDKNRHSGTGRFAKLKMRTLSLYESGFSNGAVSLSALFNAEEIGTPINSEMTIEKTLPKSVVADGLE